MNPAAWIATRKAAAKLVPPASAVVVALLCVASLTAQPRADARALRGLPKIAWSFWTDGPWVFDAAADDQPLPRIHHPRASRSVNSIAIRLDDDTTGTLRVSPRPCRDGECDDGYIPEEYRIDIVDARGRRIARTSLWAAYHVFDIVPIDLVDGPGDELIIIDLPAHSSPPPAPEAKIWRVGTGGTINLVAERELLIGGRLRTAGPDAIPCAEWRARVFVNAHDPKPRPLRLRTDFAARPRCDVAAPGAEQLAILRRGKRLAFRHGFYRGRFPPDELWSRQ